MATKITAFTRANLRELHEKISAALAAVGTEYGIVITAKPGRFSPGEYRFTSEATCGASIDTRGEEERRREVFERECHFFGLKPEHFGHEFTHQGTRFRICGLQPQAPKFPVLATNSRGKVYKFRLETTGLVSADDAAAAIDLVQENRAIRRAIRRHGEI